MSRFWIPKVNREERYMDRATLDVGTRAPHDLHHAERALLEAAEGNDYTTGIVPLDKRRSILTMILLWASLQASVSMMYSTYLARSGGLDLAGVLWAGVISFCTMLAYGYGSAS